MFLAGEVRETSQTKVRIIQLHPKSYRNRLHFVFVKFVRSKNVDLGVNGVSYFLDIFHF